MNQYTDCTKEELLDIIHHLEQKVESLSIQESVTTTSPDLSPSSGETYKSRFKDKYSCKILDTLPDMLSVLDRDGQYVDLVSSEKTNHVGLPGTEIVGKNIKDFLPDEAYRNVKKNLDNAFLCDIECIAHHDLEVNGTTHHFENRILPLDNNNALCVCRDVTDAVEVQHNLESAYRKMKLAEKMASLGQWYFYFKNQEFCATEIIYTILERDASRTISAEDYFDLVHPEDRERLKSYLFYPSIHEDNNEHRVIINGKIKYLHTKVSDIFTVDGYKVVEGFVQDVTDIVASRNELNRMTSRQEEQQNKIKELNSIMDTILNNIPVYLFMKDTGNDFRYLYWNKAFEEFSQIPASKTLGKTDFEIFPNPDDAKKFREDDLQMIKGGKKIELQEEYISASGETRVVNTIKTLVPASNGKAPLLVGVSWDITDQKNAEQELINARKKAEESDKLKSAFLANMSHEIRTPLNAIVGFSKLIAESDDSDEKKQFIEIVDNNVNLLLQLINDILDLSKIEAGMLEFVYRTVNLKELCKNIYDIHFPRTAKTVTLIFDNTSPDISTVSDSNRLSQVLSNLLTNAQKFTNKGEIRFGYTANEEYIEFYVKDTGTGIAKEKIDSIFNRFIKLNNFAQGTGLGLSICKMITETLGGKIWANSTENAGSTFSFTIPRGESCPINNDSELTSQSITKKHMDNQKKILVAEDVDSNFLLLKALIGKTYTLIRAYNGKEAVELFGTTNPDLILMDIKMPEMNGLEATALIREKSKEIPIIALTAFAFESDKQEALGAGCNDFLTKPLSSALLQQTIEKYI